MSREQNRRLRTAILKSRRDKALERPELRGEAHQIPRTSPSGVTSPMLKAPPPTLQRALDEFRKKKTD